MHAYKNDYGGSQLLIEKFFNIHKFHQNILDQDHAFLEQMEVKIKQNSNHVKEERLSLAEELRKTEDKADPHQKELAKK